MEKLFRLAHDRAAAFIAGIRSEQAVYGFRDASRRRIYFISDIMNNEKILRAQGNRGIEIHIVKHWKRTEESIWNSTGQANEGIG